MENKIDINKIDITEEALEFLLKNRTDNATPETKLRLGVSGGFCNGFAYMVEWTNSEAGLKDLIFNFKLKDESLTIFVDKKSILFLDGTILDTEKKNLLTTLKLRNPNETSSCGCGKSFTTNVGQ